MPLELEPPELEQQPQPTSADPFPDLAVTAPKPATPAAFPPPKDPEVPAVEEIEVVEVVEANQPPTSRKKKRSRAVGFDALAELEKLRKDSLRKKPASSNGKRQINRDFRLTLKRSDLARAHRFSLKLQLEDEQLQAVDEEQHLHIDIDNAKSLERLLLRFDIALDSKT